MGRMWLAATALVVLGGNTRAEDLRRDFVAADARWVVHVDLQSVIGSDIFKMLNTEGDFIEEMEEVRSELGIDPREDVYSVTVYGTTASEDQAVVLIHASDRIDAALERAKAEGVHAFEHAGYKMYGFEDEDFVGSLLEKRDGSRLVALSSGKDRLVHAIEVLRGRADGLDDVGNGGLVANARQGAFVYVSADTSLLPLEDIEPVSNVAKLVRGLEFELGQNDSLLFARASIDTKSSDDALKVNQVLQGATALLSLVPDDGDKDLKKIKELARSVQIFLRGSVVTVEFQHEAEALLREFKDDDGEFKPI